MTYKVVQHSWSFEQFKQNKRTELLNQYRTTHNITAAKLDVSYTKPIYETVEQYSNTTVCNTRQEVIDWMLSRSQSFNGEVVPKGKVAIDGSVDFTDGIKLDPSPSYIGKIAKGIKKIEKGTGILWYDHSWNDEFNIF